MGRNSLIRAFEDARISSFKEEIGHIKGKLGSSDYPLIQDNRSGGERA